jgi:hypothetical protein
MEERGSLGVWGTMQQAGISRVRYLMRSLKSFKLHNPSITMTLEYQKMYAGSKARLARETDVTAISEPILLKIWDPWHLTTL